MEIINWLIDTFQLNCGRERLANTRRDKAFFIVIFQLRSYMKTLLVVTSQNSSLLKRRRINLHKNLLNEVFKFTESINDILLIPLLSVYLLIISSNFSRSLIRSRLTET